MSGGRGDVLAASATFVVYLVLWNVMVIFLIELLNYFPIDTDPTGVTVWEAIMLIFSKGITPRVVHQFFGLLPIVLLIATVLSCEAYYSSRHRFWVAYVVPICAYFIIGIVYGSSDFGLLLILALIVTLCPTAICWLIARQFWKFGKA
jgi:hypothetical protein